MARDDNGNILWAEKRIEFEKEKKIYDSAILTFKGVEGYDVYNCSIPFVCNGERYIYGRVERRDEWCASHVCRFKEVEPDVFEKVPNSRTYELEDPFLAFIGGERVLGGTNVHKQSGELETYDCRFYKGNNPEHLAYFTTGPRGMKDIRLVQMKDGIGVFTRPEGLVGFTVINDIMELNSNIIENAPIVDFIDENGYGGANQCYYLESGMIGIIGHMVYPKALEDGRIERVYINVAAVFDPESRKTIETKIIGTRRCYPASDAIRRHWTGIPLDDTAFTSGIVMREDGKADLYSGLSDALEGRITIDYPFEKFGKIIYGDALK